MQALFSLRRFAEKTRPVYDDAGERDILDRMQSSTRGCKRLKRSKGLSPRREMEV